MIKADEKDSWYFDDALEEVSEENIVEAFMNELKYMRPPVNGQEMIKYTCQDWRMLFCTIHRELLKREILIVCNVCKCVKV